MIGQKSKKTNIPSNTRVNYFVRSEGIEDAP